MGSWKGRGNQYIEFARVLYCKLPTNGKQLLAFPHRALTGICKNITNIQFIHKQNHLCIGSYGKSYHMPENTLTHNIYAMNISKNIITKNTSKMRYVFKYHQKVQK